MFFVLSKTLGIMLLPTNFLLAAGLLGAVLLATRLARLGRKLLVASVVLLAICGFSPLGELAALSSGAAFPAVGCRARRAGRHRRSRRRDRHGCFRCAPDCGVQSRGRSHHRGCRACASLSERSRIIYSGGSANLVSDDRRKKPTTSLAAIRESRNFQRAPHDRAAFAQHFRERRIFQRARRAEKRRAMAVGDLGLPYAAIRRLFFASIGFAVEPYPVDWRLAGSADLLKFSVFPFEGFAHTDIGSPRMDRAWPLTGSSAEPAPFSRARAGITATVADRRTTRSKAYQRR